MPDDALLRQYWPFAGFSALVLIIVLRLLLRERLALQGTISYMLFLGIFGLCALMPKQATELAHAMGFAILANFLFSIALIALALMHLQALVSLYRAVQRTTQLTQDLALLEERVTRNEKGRNDDRAAAT
ncbi:MAG TPA: DUF2304 domain-containing protein [Polyangiaceae bacterium]|nr:DUF2304 domain-containing protein [Polyangiaceae bacterium]